MGVVTEFARTTAGALIVLARQEQNLSQRELADRAGVAQSEIAKIENGKRQPSIPTLQRILAGAGLELRLRLAPLDDHDGVLAARHDQRSSAEQADAEVRHSHNVAQFAANAHRR